MRGRALETGIARGFDFASRRSHPSSRPARLRAPHRRTVQRRSSHARCASRKIDARIQFVSRRVSSRLVSSRLEPNPSNRPDRAFVPRPTHDAADSRDSFTRSTPPAPSVRASIEPTLALAVVAILSRSRIHSFACTHASRAPAFARLSSSSLAPRVPLSPTLSHRRTHLASSSPSAVGRRSSSVVVVCRPFASRAPASPRRRRLARREPFVSIDAFSCLIRVLGCVL